MKQAGTQAHPALEPTLLPRIPPEAPLDASAVRSEAERSAYTLLLLSIVVLWTLLSLFLFRWVGVGGLAIAWALFAGGTMLVSYISWSFAETRVLGDGVRVSDTQLPQIHRMVQHACRRLDVQAPTVIVLQSDGVFDLLVGKRFSRRGLLIITSAMLDMFAERNSSRELMMYIGRQLGHIKAGHFDNWFVKDVLGYPVLPLHARWRRECHYTADRIGMLIAGDAAAAERALFMMMSGAKVAPSVGLTGVQDQARDLDGSIPASLRRFVSHEPDLVQRVIRLRAFASAVRAPGADPAVGAIDLPVFPLRSVPLLLVHGHDRAALLELHNFLLEHMPHVAARIATVEEQGALTIAEKVELHASTVVGAIALLTPDDEAIVRGAEAQPRARARQNVLLEIGWIWGRLGRDRCLLLTKGDDIEIPSDLHGSEYHTFSRTPRECSDALRSFVERVGRSG